MVVSLRFQILGRRNNPIYRIVATDPRRSRESGKFIEQIGLVDPVKQKNGTVEVQLDFERCKYWISQGAVISNGVHRILALAGLKKFICLFFVDTNHFFVGHLPPVPKQIPLGWNSEEWDNTFKNVENYYRKQRKILGPESF